jgi:hypothetical protein
VSEEHFESESLYQATMTIARSMLERGVITQVEYSEIDTIMLDKYRPLLGSLCAGTTPKFLDFTAL